MEVLKKNFILFLWQIWLFLTTANFLNMRKQWNHIYLL